VESSVSLNEGDTSASVEIHTAPVASDTPVLITAQDEILGTTKSGKLTVLAPTLRSITFTSSSVVGGVATKGTVTLNGATAVDTVVTLSGGDSSVTVPTQVTVPAGASSATFTIPSQPVAANDLETVTASLNGNSKSASFTVDTPAVAHLGFSPSQLVGGGTINATVTLNGIAAVDTPITVTSSDPSATINGSVVVPAGSTSATFTISTSTVSAKTSVLISATAGNGTQSGHITELP
jgi:hypothetical protein